VQDQVDRHQRRPHHVLAHEAEMRVVFLQVGNVVRPARDQVVQADHLVPAAQQRVAHVAADEAGAPRDHHAHGGVLSGPTTGRTR
jgi:hypothetical protein